MSDATRAVGPGLDGAPGETGSVERRLPLLMTAVLAVVLGVSLAVTWTTLSRSAADGTRDRLTSGARQIASTIDADLAMRGSRLRETARLPRIHAALVRGDTAGVGALLRDLSAGVADTLPAELWSRDGDLVAAARAARIAAPATLTRAVLAALTLHDEQTGNPRTPHTSYSPMYGADAGAVHFVAVTPVFDADAVIGYVAQERRVTGPASATQRYRDLLGEPASLLIRNRDGSLWALAPGTPTAAPRLRRSGETLEWQRDEQMLMAAEAPLRTAPWIVALDSPVASLRGRTRGTMLVLGGVSLLLLLVGAGAAWLVARRITAPLVTLTRAAEAIARGDEPRRSGARARPRDEVGRLAVSFDAMAQEIVASRQELEQRVDEARRTADALERTNAQLAEAIASAERAQREAEHANSAKSDFLAVMSHELRTPLNAIAGYTQLLDIGVYGPLNDAQRDALDRIGRSETHLLSLINDVLTFAKIDAGRVSFDFADVPLDDVLAGIEPLVAPQIRAKGLRYAYLSCDPAITVHVDGEKLRQVMLNLVTNAIKFTPTGGRVIVECEAEATTMRVHVRDTGVGIPAERLARIFDPFVQGDRALNKPSEGVGLGLAIAHDLATAMGATLHVASIPGQGSTFTVELPRAGSGVAAPPLPMPNDSRRLREA